MRIAHNALLDLHGAQLFQKNICPLPLASNPPELRHLLHRMKMTGQQPALFVINTFGVENDLKELDMLIGDTPILFFRRELMWLKKRGKKCEGVGLTTRIGSMRPRLTAIWYYGGTTYTEVADKTASRVMQFLQNQDFSCLEGSIHLNQVTPHRLGIDSSLSLPFVGKPK